MSRVTKGVKGRRRRNRILARTKGYTGGRKLYRQGRETVEKGLVYAYRDRKVRKREFRRRNRARSSHHRCAIRNRVMANQPVNQIRTPTLHLARVSLSLKRNLAITLNNQRYRQILRIANGFRRN